MAALEAATFACPANEQHLVALRMPDQATASVQPDQAASGSAAARLPPASAPAAAAVPMEGIEDGGAQSEAAARGMNASAPCAVGCGSPSGKGRLEGMLGELGNGDGRKRQRLRPRSGSQAGESGPRSGADAQQETTFPAWLVTQVRAWQHLSVCHTA